MTRHVFLLRLEQQQKNMTCHPFLFALKMRYFRYNSSQNLLYLFQIDPKMCLEQLVQLFGHGYLLFLRKNNGKRKKN